MTTTACTPSGASTTSTFSGCATSATADLADIFRRALDCDPKSAFGGIIAFNQPIDGATAEAVSKQFVEVLIAPGYSDGALEIFKAKANVRVLQIDLPPGGETAWHKGRNSHDIKRVGSGILIQTADNLEVRRDDLRIVTKKQPTAAQMDDLLFAWRVAKYVKSNAIIFCGGGMTLGVGAGQMSRVDSTRIAPSRHRTPA